MANKSVRGLVVLVTGAGRGIGRAIAIELSRAGARLAIADLDLAPAESVVRELGQGARAYHVDVSKKPSVEALVAAVNKDLGPIDVLINNAGIMSLGGFLDQPPSRDAAQLAVNVGGVLFGMRAVLPGMLARRSGHIVNIASVAGRVGAPYAAVYSASKFAVIGLTEAVRAETDGQGVDFTYVMPSLVETDLIAGAGRPAWPKVATPEDVARAVHDAIQTRKVDVYVPKSTRLSMILPALLPRAVLDKLGRLLKVDQMFAHVDEGARQRYSERLDREDKGRDDDLPPGPFGTTPRANA